MRARGRMFLGLLNRRSRVGARIPTPYERPVLHSIERRYKYHFFFKITIFNRLQLHPLRRENPILSSRYKSQNKIFDSEYIIIL
jgi:hypothetical protein